MVPLLKHVVLSCIGISYVKKPDPVQSWSALALIDCLVVIDGLTAYLPKEVVVKELIEVWFSYYFLGSGDVGVPFIRSLMSFDFLD